MADARLATLEIDERLKLIAYRSIEPKKLIVSVTAYYDGLQKSDMLWLPIDGFEKFVAEIKAGLAAPAPTSEVA